MEYKIFNAQKIVVEKVHANLENAFAKMVFWIKIALYRQTIWINILNLNLLYHQDNG